MHEASKPAESHLSAGTTIFHQGDEGDEMFVISRGRVRLSLGGADGQREIAVLEPGDFFGELSLLSGARRTATAVALDDCVLLAIRRDVFAMMMQDDLEVVFRMMDALGARLSQTDRHVHDIVQTLARIRALADLLRRCLHAEGYHPLSVDLQELARAWKVSVDVVQAMLAELAREGAGALRDGRWVIEGGEQVDRLADLLARS